MILFITIAINTDCKLVQAQLVRLARAHGPSRHVGNNIRAKAAQTRAINGVVEKALVLHKLLGGDALERAHLKARDISLAMRHMRQHAMKFSAPIFAPA